MGIEKKCVLVYIGVNACKELTLYLICCKVGESFYITGYILQDNEVFVMLLTIKNKLATSPLTKFPTCFLYLLQETHSATIQMLLKTLPHFELYSINDEERTAPCALVLGFEQVVTVAV